MAEEQIETDIIKEEDTADMEQVLLISTHTNTHHNFFLNTLFGIKF